MRRGFTLLEVMVAVAILGLALTVILSAQAGLYSSSGTAQRTSVALGLARCKMSELEEKMLKLGYPEIEEHDEGACCADDTRQEYRCKWTIERVELPQAESSSASGADGGAGGPLGALASALGGGASPAGSAGPGALGVLTQLASNPSGLASAGDGGIGQLAGALTGGASGGVGALAPIVMTMVYPQLKPMLEASIRKVSLKVTWTEGVRAREVALVQYLTNPTRGGLVLGTPTGGPDPAAAGTSGQRTSK